MNYHYYDSPEGEDAFKKLLVTTKYAGATGILAATYDVLLLTKPKGYANTIGRYAYFTVPMMGMAAAFTTSTYMATNLRKKDDKLNYVIGACAAGGVFGAWQRSTIAGFWGCLLFSIAGILKKSSIQDGWQFFNDPKLVASGTVNSYKSDYTLTKHIPGNWTK